MQRSAYSKLSRGAIPSGTIEGLSSLPRVKRKIPGGLPSDLLQRRPDLLAAEARVDAALKELAASRKSLLPAIAITGPQRWDRDNR